MAEFRVTRLMTVPDSSTPLIDRLAGPGWAETSDRVIRHILAHRHRFYIETAQGRLWLAVRTDPLTGAHALVFDGGSVRLADLPIEWGEPVVAPPRPRTPVPPMAPRSLFARLRQRSAVAA